MIKRKYKYIVLGFITIAIFSIINISIIQFNLLYQSNKNRKVTYKTENLISESQIVKQEPESQINFISEKNQSQKSNWRIVIPKIRIEAPIEQGTTTEVLAEYVGHIENTPKFDGNIGLAAHNNTYFKNLKNIKIGDEIIYVSEFGNRQYKVNEIQKIEQTDWTKLQNTQENKITLITCVKNMPHLRLCVQAKQI